MGAGNNAGHARAPSGRYFFLLNSDAWVAGDGLERARRVRRRASRRAPSSGRGCEPRRVAAALGARLSDAVAARDRVPLHPQARAALAASEPALRRRLRPRRGARGRLGLRAPRCSCGARRPTRSGSSTRTSSCSARRPTGCTASAQAGWKVWFFPGAEVVHVGGASHGGRLYVENLRGHLRFLAKHRGPARGRAGAALLLLVAAAARAPLPRRAAPSTARASRFLASGDAPGTLAAR